MLFRALCLLGCLAALAAATPARAQDPLPPLSEYQVRRFLPEDGLPVRWIGGLAQSPSGELFAATGEGLYRFDGYRFSTEGLETFEGVYLLQDLHFSHAGRLWLRTSDRRVGFFDEARSGILPAPDDAADGVFSISSTPGVTWFATGSGVRWLSDPTSEPRALAVGPSPGDPTIAVIALADGELLRIGQERLARVETNAAGHPTAFRPLGPAYRLREAQRSSYLVDADGVWLFTDGGALRYRGGTLERWPSATAAPSGGRGGRVGLDDVAWVRDRPTPIGSTAAGALAFPPVALPGGEIVDRAEIALRTRSGEIWAAMTGPSDARQRHHLVRIRDGVSEPLDLAQWTPATVVNGLLEDHEGGVWIATDQGVLQLVTRRARALDADLGQVASFTTAVLADSAGLWVGSWGGGVQRFRGGVPVDFGRAAGLPSDRIRALFRADDGTLWVGTSDGPARWIGGRFESVADAREAGAGAALEIRAFAETPDGSFWMGGVGGLRRWTPRGWRSVQDPALVDDEIWMLHADRRGDLWIGTRDGLRRRTEQGFERIDASGAPGGDMVVSAFEEENGTLWFGTYRSGLYRLRGDSFSRVGTDHGLHHDGVWAMIPDPSGGVWMSSDQGVFRVDHAALHEAADALPGARLSPIVLQEAEGLPSRESNRASPAAARLPDGRLVFNSQDGLSIVDPRAAGATLPPPRTRIRAVLADGEAIEVARAGGSVAPKGTRHLHFEFHALSYRAPNQLRYRFRLDGYDEDWYDAGSDRRATYTNLPPGDYTFRVQAAGPGGGWEAATASLPVHLTPFLWQRTSVQLLGLLLLFGAVALAYRYHLERRLQVVRMRLRIAADLHDDVGSSLSSIALLAEMLRARPEMEHIARDRLDRIHHAAADTIEALREIIWLVDPSHGNTTELIARLRQIAADLLVGTEFEFRVGEIEETSLSMSVMRSALLIQKEALHNITRHAPTAPVEIEVSEARGMLRLDIRDRGLGFDPHATHHGYGLRNMRRRAEEAGGRLELESDPGGTRVVFETRIA